MTVTLTVVERVAILSIRSSCKEHNAPVRIRTLMAGGPYVQPVKGYFSLIPAYSHCGMAGCSPSEGHSVIPFTY